MPWFPDFVGAVELARRQTRAEGEPDPVGVYLDALNHGDPHALRNSWPGEVVVHDPHAGEVRGHRQLRQFVHRNQVWLAERHARIETRGRHLRRRAGRGRAAGPPHRRRPRDGVAGRGRRRVARRPVGGVPHVLQPAAGRPPPPRPAADPPAHRRPARGRRRPPPRRAASGRHRRGRGHLHRGGVRPRARRSPAAPRPRRAARVLRPVLQRRGRRRRAAVCRSPTTARAARSSTTASAGVVAPWRPRPDWASTSGAPTACWPRPASTTTSSGAPNPLRREHEPHHRA